MKKKLAKKSLPEKVWRRGVLSSRARILYRDAAVQPGREADGLRAGARADPRNPRRGQHGGRAYALAEHQRRRRRRRQGQSKSCGFRQSGAVVKRPYLKFLYGNHKQDEHFGSSTAASWQRAVGGNQSISNLACYRLKECHPEGCQ